jgi:hypothetical protein
MVPIRTEGSSVQIPVLVCNSHWGNYTTDGSTHTHTVQQTSISIASDYQRYDAYCLAATFYITASLFKLSPWKLMGQIKTTARP